ncbi:MAG: carbohydrate ABC transporter permease [Monoglobaceae bacterium]
MKRFDNKTEGLLNWNDLKHGKYKAAYWFMYACLLLLSLVCLLPIIWMVMQGFMTPKEIYAVPPKFLPQSFDFGKILRVWKKAKLYKSFVNSGCLIVGCLAADVFFNGLCGYFLAKIRAKGHGILNYIIFWSMMLPGISMVPLYCALADMNLLGSFVPLWLRCGAQAFNVMLFRNFFMGIPNEYMEAAKMDGCSNLGIFTRIILPLSKPIVAVVSIFCILGTWGDFFWPYLVLGNTSREPVAVFTYRLTQGVSYIMEDEKMLLLTLIAIPPLIIFAFLSKHIMGGLNMSGIKG